MLDFRHFLAKQLDHVLRRGARQNNRRTTQRGVDFHDHGAHTVAGAQVFFRNHVAAAQAAFNPTGLNDQVALVHAFDGADKNLVAARHEVVQQHFTLGITDFLQDDLLGSLRANAANRQAFNRLFDVVAFFDVGDFIACIGDQLFSFGILQAGLVSHYQPAAKGFIFAGITVYRDTNIHTFGIHLLGGRGKRKLDGTKDDVTLDVFFTRDGINQHQQFAIHFTSLPF